MKVLRMYADAEGESHFEEVELATTKRELVPDYPSLEFSNEMPVESVTIVHLPSGMPAVMDYHPAPRRLFLTYLHGETEFEVSDGERRTTRPGDLYLFEDAKGRGHLSMNAGDEDFVIAIARIGN